MVLTTFALARKLEPKGISVNCLHPGFVMVKAPTNILEKLASRILLTPQQGAATTLYLALSKKVSGKTGGYFEKSQLSKPKKEAFDVQLQDKVWEISENIITTGQSEF